MKAKLLALVSIILLWNSPISAQRRILTTSSIPQKIQNNKQPAQRRIVTNSTSPQKIQSNKRPLEKKTDNISLFQLYDNPLKNEVEKDIKDAVFFKLDFAKLAKLKSENRSSLTIDLPISAQQTATFYLKSVKIVSDDFKVVNNKNETVPYTPGLYYQGTLAGNTPSLAAWSLFDNSIMTVFSWHNENYNLGIWKHPSNTQQDIYILYKDSKVQFPRSFECNAEKLPTQEKSQTKSIDNTPQSQFTNCVKVYFECDYQMYLDNGNSTTNVANFVTGMFNTVQTIYTNESIGIEISEIYTWTVSDHYLPYNTSDDILSDFETYRTTFNGDLAHLLSTRNLSAGGLAYVDALCAAPYNYGYSNIDNNYIAYPSYSWTTYVVTHELGHNIGSNHTQWCGWSGGALDDCYPVEGNCSPGPTPTNGGTIMSYCHFTSAGIVLTNGFGTQPGNAIRTAYNNANCLTACASTDPICANATAISGCDSVNLQTFNGGGTGSWNNNSASACGNTATGTEKVYTFVAPSTGTYNIKVTAASGNMHYAWKTGACGPNGWTCIGNINSLGQYGTMSWTAGTTYYIMLDGENTNTGSHSFYIKCPTNTGGGGGNPCANIVSISGCGSANTQNFAGDTVGSWISGACGFLAPGKETIYSFVAPATGNYNLTISSATGYVDYFWKTSACDSTGWNCIVDTNLTGTFGNLPWTAGTTYYILVDDEAVDGIASSHTFHINCPVDPNPCNNITAISGCGSTSAQTFYGGLTGNWNSNTASVCGYSAPGPEQIYTFVAPTTGNYNLTISSATGYVDYFWKTGSCDSTGWTCIVDTNVAGTFGNLSWTAGTTYYILLDDEAVSGNASTHSFFINCPNTNTSDPCANIIAITSCDSTNTQTFNGGTTGSWNSNTASVCGYSAPGLEQIYSFIAPTTGIYNIAITSATGYVDYFWKASTCDSTGWTCIVDTNVTGIFGNFSWTAGTTYYILLDDEAVGGTASSHSFYITCADSNNTTDPCANPTIITSCGPNSSQTYTGGGNGAWHTLSNNACSQISTGTEQVFSFTPTTTGVYNINVTAASGYVSYLWKTASCSSTGWNCIGNINASGLYGVLSMTSGTTYYIALDDHDSVQGNHTFFIECPASNPCANATPINGCGITNVQNYTGGSTGSWYTNNNNPCGFSSTGSESIYTFAPASTGTYSIEVTAASGKVAYMWKAASCAIAGWTCIDDVTAPGPYGSMTWNVGTTYYLLLDDENSTTGTHSFYINCGNNPSGIDEYDASQLNIFPNPSNGNFTVVIDGLTQEKLQIEVVNMLGETIYNYTNTNVSGKFNKEIELNTVAKGIYTISLNRGNKTYHKKIIVE